MMPSMLGTEEKDFNEFIENYQWLVENTVECIWLFDFSNQRYKYISPSIFDLRGVTLEDAMKEKLEDSLTPESLEKIYQMAAKHILKFQAGDLSPQNRWSIDEFQQYHKDGTIIDVEISTRFIECEAPGIIEILGVSRDISKRKKMEAALFREIIQKNDTIEKLKATEDKLNQLIHEFKENNQALKFQSMTDKLTGIFNRHYFDQKVIEELNRAERYHYPVSLVMFDLDHFKKINDQWGHDYGDEVLVRMASIVRKLIRSSDVLARWGGEEFVVMLPQTSKDEAVIAAEKLRCAVEQIMHPAIGQITASFGVSEKLTGETFQNWLIRADRAMYRAKNLGRNCVVAWNDTEFMPDKTSRLEWNEAWSCGNRQIDHQHMELLELGNSLMDMAIKVSDPGKLLSQFDLLLGSVDQHFKDEDEILRRSEYPNSVQHGHIHSQLIMRTLQLRDRLMFGNLQSSDILSFVIDELIVGHLLTEDVKFFSYIKGMTEL
jgi:diguanylate cyclase (GGDEF)-like protein/hemerythrin-like metal-binding protein/PAS domain S-box-containing protein